MGILSISTEGLEKIRKKANKMEFRKFKKYEIPQFDSLNKNLGRWYVDLLGKWDQYFYLPVEFEYAEEILKTAHDNGCRIFIDSGYAEYLIWKRRYLQDIHIKLPRFLLSEQFTQIVGKELSKDKLTFYILENTNIKFVDKIIEILETKNIITKVDKKDAYLIKGLTF
jgi:hypothetical protein